jgi:hypothetical protein
LPREAVEITKRLLDSAEDNSFDSYLEIELMAATLTQLDPAAARARQTFAAPEQNQTINDGDLHEDCAG